MIKPIHGLKYHQFTLPLIGAEIHLVQEKENLHDQMAIAAYNKLNQQIGYISAKRSYNKRVYSRML